MEPERNRDLGRSASPGMDTRVIEDLLVRYADRRQAGERIDAAMIREENPNLDSKDVSELLRHFDLVGIAVQPPKEPGDVRVLGDFRLLREAGRGGMGIVYEAVQVSLNRRVALKVLPFGSVLDATRVERFQNEARAAARLQHPNIVPVHAVGAEGGTYYYAMPFIEGRTLAEILAEIRDVEATRTSDARTERLGSLSVGSMALLEGRFGAREAPTPGAGQPSTGARPAKPPDGRDPHPIAGDRGYLQSVMRIGIQAARALDAAHRAGIIHRDVKPSNLILDDSGKLWLTDFGLARFPEASTLSGSGTIIGTLRYMSPEQALGRRGLVDQRTDIYSLGVTLYELLTLRAAIDGDSDEEVLQALAFRSPVPPRRWNHRIPRDVEAIVLKASSRSVEDRYETAADLADDLLRALEGRPIVARRPGIIDGLRDWTRRHPRLVGAAAILLCLTTVVLAASGWMARRAERSTRAVLARLQYGEGIRQLEAGNRLGLLDLVEARRSANGLTDLETAVSRLWLGWQERWEGRMLESLAVPPDQGEGLVAIAPAGSVAARAWSTRVEALDLTTGVRCGEPIIHDRPVSAVALDDRGEILATATQGREIFLWNVPGMVQARGPPLREDGIPRLLEFSRDGRLLASASYAPTGSPKDRLRIWRVPEGDPVWPLETADTSATDGADFHPSRPWIALGAHSGFARVWDMGTGALIKEVETGATENTTRVAWSRDGSLLLVTSWAGRARVLDAATFEDRAPPVEVDDWIYSSALGPDGKTFAFGTRGGTFRLHRVADGGLIREVSLGHRVGTVDYSPDGRRIALGVWNGTVVLTTPDPDGPLEFLHHPEGRQTHARFIRNGEALATHDRRHIVLWSAEARPDRAIVVDVREARCLRFSTDGRTLAIGSTNSLTLFDIAGNAPLAVAVPGTVLAMSFVDGGRRLLAAFDDGSTAIAEAPSRTLGPGPWRLPAAPKVVALADDGSAIAWVQGSSLLAQESDSPSPIVVKESIPLPEAWRISFAKGGAALAVGHLDDWTVEVRPRGSWGQHAPPMYGTEKIASFAFGPGASAFAISCQDRTTQLHDLTMFRFHRARDSRPPIAHRKMAFDLDFSADGSLLAAAEADAVSLWSLGLPGAPLIKRLAAGDRVRTVRFAPDGRWLAAATPQRVVIWSMERPPVSLAEVERRTWAEIGVRRRADGLNESIPAAEWNALRAAVRGPRSREPR